MQLQVFNYGQNEIRTVLRNGSPWFVVRDVLRVLEINNVSWAVGRLDEDEFSSTKLSDSLGREQDTFICNEPGLYNLTLGSRKPQARAFKRWITHEVLPSIRSTGKYEFESSNVVPLSKDQALVTVLRTTADLVEQHQELRQLVVEQAEEIKGIRNAVNEQITIDSGEQRQLQKAIARRICEMEENAAFRAELFRQLYREIKDRWAVPSYRDVRRNELQEVLLYVNAWKPRIAHVG